MAHFIPLIAAAIVAGATVYSAEQSRKSASKAADAQASAVRDAEKKNRELQISMKKKADEESSRLKAEQARIDAENQAKKDREAKARGALEESLAQKKLSGRRALLKTNPTVWESEANVTKKTLLGG